jgi:hypothetical protein
MASSATDIRGMDAAPGGRAAGTGLAEEGAVGIKGGLAAEMPVTAAGAAVALQVTPAG